MDALPRAELESVVSRRQNPPTRWMGQRRLLKLPNRLFWPNAPGEHVVRARDCLTQSCARFGGIFPQGRAAGRLPPQAHDGRGSAGSHRVPTAISSRMGRVRKVSGRVGVGPSHTVLARLSSEGLWGVEFGGVPRPQWEEGGGAGGGRQGWRQQWMRAQSLRQELW